MPTYRDLLSTLLRTPCGMLPCVSSTAAELTLCLSRLTGLPSTGNSVLLWLRYSLRGTPLKMQDKRAVLSFLLKP